MNNSNSSDNNDNIIVNIPIITVSVRNVTYMYMLWDTQSWTVSLVCRVRGAFLIK